MRNIMSTIILVLISITSFCQAWQLLNPIPTNADLNSICFVDENTGFAVGSPGLILKTIDGGILWSVFYTGTNAGISSVCFIDTQIGFCTAFDFNTDQAELLKTENGGETWEIQTINTQSILSQILFIDPDIGFLIGEEGVIFKTINGGLNWELISTTPHCTLSSIFFVDSNTGWIGGWDNYAPQDHRGLILKTTDGGNTWALASSGLPSFIKSVYFSDLNKGYLVGIPKSMKSSDGGNSWTLMNTPSGSAGFNSASFMNADSLLAAGPDGNIARTCDGGDSWTTIPSGTEQELSSIFMVNSEIGIIAGRLGTILKTQNGGNSWQLISKGTLDHLNTIRFTDENTGYCVSNKGSLLKTTDAGTTWCSSDIASGYRLKGICASSKTSLHCYTYKFLPEDSSYIFRCTNAGESWDITYKEYGMQIRSISFPDSVTGFAVGYDDNMWHAFLLKTTDGGSSWSMNNTFGGTGLNAVFFLDDQTGYVAGNGEVRKTIDGGQTWNSYLVYCIIYSMWFVNQDTGFAVGVGCDTNEGIIFKTTDGGNSWTSQPSGTPYWLNEVTFSDEQTGYAVGEDGIILKTTDCGVSWHLQESPSMFPFKSVCTTGLNTAYIAGLFGTILKTTTGGTVQVEEKPFLPLQKIYPNPATDIFTLEISTPTEKSHYSIYDLKGQELVKGTFTSNKIKINISKYPKGLYFIRVIAQNNVTVNKIIKE